MRSVSPQFAAALLQAREKGIVPRKFFWATVRERGTGLSVNLGFWTGDDTITTDVVSGLTGLPETRTYIGGVDLQVGTIPRVSDLTAQTIRVGLSGIHPSVQRMVREYDARFAKAEIHVGLLDTDTRLPVAPAEVEFLGEIDEAPIETPQVGGESRVQLAVRSDAILMLTRINPRKRSYESQKLRRNDEWGLYANAVRTWQIAWGEEQQG